MLREKAEQLESESVTVILTRLYIAMFNLTLKYRNF